MLHIKVFTFSPVQENTYVLWNESGEAVIIDPGCYFDEDKETLQSWIQQNQLRPQWLLNTHCHLDHVFGNRFVHAIWGLEPHFHELEQPVFDYAPTAGLMWNLPFEQYEGPVHYLKEGQEIFIGKESLRVSLTPGHSPGSISFYSASNGFVISGDVLFHLSVGRTDLPGGNFEVLQRTIREQLYALPENTQVYSGHGPVTTIGWEKQHNPFVKALH